MGKSDYTGAALSASNCNTKIKVAFPQHAADMLYWCIASRAEIVDTKIKNWGTELNKESGSKQSSGPSCRRHLSEEQLG